jgi:hypothetical protein
VRDVQLANTNDWHVQVLVLVAVVQAEPSVVVQLSPV